MGADFEKPEHGATKPAFEPQTPKSHSSSSASPGRPGDYEAQPKGIDVEALGRQRPAAFKSIWSELGFCFSLVISMLMAVSAPLQPPPALPSPPA